MMITAIIIAIVIAILSIWAIRCPKKSQQISVIIIIVTCVGAVIESNNSSKSEDKIKGLNGSIGMLSFKISSDSQQLDNLSKSLNNKTDSDRIFEDSLKLEYHVIRTGLNEPRITNEIDKSIKNSKFYKSPIYNGDKGKQDINYKQ